VTLTISTTLLSYGTQGDDVAHVHRALQALGRDIPASELHSRVLGDGTVAVLKALQAELGLPAASGVVDDATVRAINAKLASLSAGPRVVRGTVLDANATPYTKGFIQIYRQGGAAELVLGKSAISATDGSYDLSYQIPPSAPGRVDLRVAVLSNDGKPVETTPSGTSILTDAGALEVVDFAVSAAASAPLSEFDLIQNDLQPLLAARNLADLTEDDTHHDVSLLAIQSGYSRDQVAALVRAHQLEEQTKTPAPLFYGLLRQGVAVGDANALHAANPAIRLSALQDAVSQGIVPATVGTQKIEDVLAGFKASAPPEFTALLGRILNANELNSFVAEYLQNASDPDAFWKKIAADPAFASRASDLKFTVQLGVLTNNHAPLVTAIQARTDIKQAQDLVRITEDQWTTIVQAQGVGVPPNTPGSTPQEQTQNYVQQILRQVEAAFPTPFFAERLGTTPVSAFLKSQPPYDLKKTYPEKFFQQNPQAAQSLTPQDKDQLRIHQRIYRLTSNAKETIALATKGTRSAQQIVRTDVAVFAEQNKDILTADRAREIHANAQRVNALAMALHGENSSTLNRTGLAVLPRLDSAKMLAAASEIPDWEALFGSFDACACTECASAHGPAAYLVDILHFLSERGAKEALFARRPDLGDVELSCENTNTVLPFIDLVNEILEQTVAPPAAFAPSILAPALQADLAQPLATSALAAAFNPPLQPGARVEVLEAGTRWRVWDEPFTYSIVKQSSNLNIVARSRQTTGSADELRATPQYRNRAAYDELSQAVYPWNLPFDLNQAEANVFLNHLGVPRVDLIAALRPLPDPFDPHAAVVYQLAAQRLGFTNVERKILVGEALTPPRQPEDFWGSTTVDALATVQVLLNRSGLSFADLDTLLATWFVNPGQTVTVSAKPDAPIDTCDTTKLQINGLTVDALSRMHRFVRLWRKIGWTASELDKVLRALAPDANTPALSNEILVRLDHLNALRTSLRISVLSALALWKPIDTQEPDSLYDSLFYNRAVYKPQDEDFRLTPDGKQLVHADALLADHAATLQAVCRLNSPGFELLVSKTDGKLTLGNLSFLYRNATLARQLGLSLQDLLTAIDLTGLNPFEVGQSQNTQLFIEAVTTIAGSGFLIPQLDYILRQRAQTSSPFVPTETFLTQILINMRADLVKAAGDSEDKKQSVVMDRVSAAIRLSADVAKSLLERVKHGNDQSLDLFLKLLDVDATQALTRSNAQAQFETLEKVFKIATIIQTLQFPSTQLDWLFSEDPWLSGAPDPPSTPVPLSSWFSLIQFQHVREQLGLQDAALEAVLTAMNAAANATDQAAQLTAKKNLIDTLSAWLGWQAEDLETLLGKANTLTDHGLLNAQLPDSYRGLDLLLHLHRAISSLKRLGVTAAEANLWCEVSVTADVAKAIRRAAKAKYDEDTWLKVTPLLQNSLRDQQREALVSYLVAHPEKWPSTPGVPDVNALYGSLLIDVEMSSCQVTSRLVQATAAVQLFAQRCLMGLESGIDMKDPKWKQWAWMKNFRVWEANREIWLYPENWLEPDLRDDKSPFFKDLENELLQSDLDNAAAEQALLRYLGKLDEVARLQIAGVFEEEDKTLHVFGRTFHTPHVYYYRRRDALNQAWTPWEKVDADIEGDQLIPVVWNHKLMLIWPIFTQKQDEKRVTMPSAGNDLEGGQRYWEIQMAWSELVNGRWTGKNLSEAVRFEGFQDQPDILFGDWIGKPVFTMAMRPLDGNQGTSGDLGGGNIPPTFDPPVTGVSAGANSLKLVPQFLLTFKGLVSPDSSSLIVRGFLRLDYAGAHGSATSGVAFPFGEFRFSGCRKIVSANHISRMFNKNFTLSPNGTQFDGMWFDSTAGELTLLDGSFPTLHNPVLALIDINERAPLPSDPSSTTANRIDIRVLGNTSTFQLLAPHQDLQFIADRPFFFMDNERAFVISSTGTSGHRTYPGDWIRGELATVGMAFDAPVPSSTSVTPTLPATFEVLVPAPGGRRIARQLTPLNLQPNYIARAPLPTFWTTRAYTFRNFDHSYVCEFVKSLAQGGIDALLSLETQTPTPHTVFENYLPTSQVVKPYPVDDVDFQSGGAYDLYNWELFFHIPLLIATHLSNDQRFEDAQRWFHYVFNPTSVANGDIPQCYWNTKPFHDRLASGYEQEAVKSIEELAADGAPPELITAVEVWRENPFNPHAVARLRTTAYQKSVVMKYLDNLIAWGDQIFRRDTRESVDEATQIYVMAAEILGRRQETIRRNLKPPVQTFNTLESNLGVLSNALEQIELLIPEPNSANSSDSTELSPDPPSNTMLYFCVPENDRLVTYWDTVADRLFKIRHCMNIEGQVRQLPLFAPPIDPALLVRAQAAGLSIGDVMNDISVPLPNYRFSVMVQKANELAAEVRNFGSQLLSVLEKRDAEALSTLRSGQELRLLQAVRDVKVKQIDEATANIEALQVSKQLAQARKQYYEGRPFISIGESVSLALSAATIAPILTSAQLRVLASELHMLGNIKVGSPTTAGYETGGDFFASSVEQSAIAMDAASAILNVTSQMTGRLGEFQRRKDEWDYQANLATIELKQIDQQLIAAEIRLAIAEQELLNHDQQIENAGEADRQLHNKFTNQDLYQWMIGQVSGLYFQSYQLAYDLAKRSEKCMQHELGQAYGATAYINFGYWDSLKKGLLAGDHLAFDLKRLEVAYLDGNKRKYELTKHVSLISLAPDQFLKLKDSGKCDFEIPEWLFDLDTPGHYMRSLEMVSATFPCVTGPYITFHCKIQLVKNSYRHSTDVSMGYERIADDTEKRFIDDRCVLEAIVTSTGQNDAGLFEPNMRDERYLPFEGAGAASTWHLELPAEFKTFDYNTISDVILHLRYTARDGGDALATAARNAVSSLVSNATAHPLTRLFSLRLEFPSEWHRFVGSTASPVNAMAVDLAANRFPYLVQGRKVAVFSAAVIAKTSATTPAQLTIAPGPAVPDPANGIWTADAHPDAPGVPGVWTFATNLDPKLLQEVFVLVQFSAS
jgi:hypothetical protein